MKFNIITIFPKIFDSYINEGILKRAQEKKLIDIKVSDLRQWTTDKRRTIDDTPYGGGAGMVMRVEPVYKALEALKLIRLRQGSGGRRKKVKVVLLSAKGRKWNQKVAREYSKLDEVIFVCGRYEGIDERVLEFIDEEISIGDYVLTGGELGAMIVIDSVSRLLPGVLGNEESTLEESHSIDGYIEYPHYTKPDVFQVGKKKYKVPEVLLGGNHREIKKWRRENSRYQTSN